MFALIRLRPPQTPFDDRGLRVAGGMRQKSLSCFSRGVWVEPHVKCTLTQLLEVFPPHFRVISTSLVPDHLTHCSSISAMLQGYLLLTGAGPPDRLE